MKVLTKKQIIVLQKELIDRFSGTHGIRDEGLLDSALNAPYQTFSGNELYPDVTAKAARLCYGLVKGHAFIDGNKRIGTHAMLIFLLLNGIELKYSDNELITIILDLASGAAGFKELSEWISDHKV